MKNSKKKNLNNLIKAREAKQKALDMKFKIFKYSRRKLFPGKVQPGTFKELLSNIHLSIYQPSLRKMEEKNFSNTKQKLPASLIYERIYNLTPDTNNPSYYIGRLLHDQFSKNLNNEDIITDFPTGISTNEFYWITARPDAIIGSDNGNYLVELKTVSESDFNFYSKTTKLISTIPDSILYQIRLYMVMFKLKSCFLCFYCFENRKSKIIQIDPQEEDFDFFRETFKIFILNNAKREEIDVKKIGKRTFSIKKYDIKNQLNEFTGNFPYKRITYFLKRAMNQLQPYKILLEEGRFTELKNKEINGYKEKEKSEQLIKEYKRRRIMKKKKFGYW